MPKLKIKGSTMRIAPGFSPADNVYIIENVWLERLLFDRGCVELAFVNACREASTQFLKHFGSEMQGRGQRLAELMLLSKGRYYFLHNAFESAFGENLQANFLATSRAKVVGSKVDISIPYFNFDAPASEIIIGDTIASGASICAAIHAYEQVRKIETVYIFSIAGTAIGARRIIDFARARNIKVYCAFGLALFGLADNGFDLSFLDPATITRDEYRERARALYGGRAISAVGWDFGTQSQSLAKYSELCYLEAKQWNLLDSDCLPFQSPPADLSLIAKERDAYQRLSGPDVPPS
jgi:hypothetical protein